MHGGCHGDETSFFCPLSLQHKIFDECHKINAHETPTKTGIRSQNLPNPHNGQIFLVLK